MIDSIPILHANMGFSTLRLVSMQESASEARPRPPRPAPPRTTPTQTREQEQISAIRTAHDEAFLYIDQGLTCDELNQTEQAVHLYSKGLRCIDRAIGEYQTAKRNGRCQGEAWAKVEQMVAKMGPTRAQIQSRVDVLIRSDDAVVRAMDDPPPSYEDSLSPTSEAGSMDWDIVDGTESAAALQLANAQQLFKITDGVQMFFISREGYVSAPSYPSDLGIYQFREPQALISNTDLIAPAFLKVGQWMYPLLPEHSPVLHANHGAYMFPDVTSRQEG